MAKAFISYSSKDNRKKEILDSVLREHGIEPVIILNRENPKDYGTDKIKKGIEEADFFIPILTSQSIYTQWINQEIGYAEYESDEGKLIIVPIVEKDIMGELKQFINHIQDLPYNYPKADNKGVENKSFKRECIRVAKYIKSITVKNKNIALDISFSYLTLRNLSKDGDISLNSSMTIENKGKEPIAIKNIEFSIIYEHYNNTIQKVDNLPFELDYYYDGQKSHHFKETPYVLNPKEIKQLYKVFFKSTERMFFENYLSNADYRPMLMGAINDIKEANAIITLHNHSKIECIIKVFNDGYKPKEPTVSITRAY